MKDAFDKTPYRIFDRLDRSCCILLDISDRIFFGNMEEIDAFDRYNLQVSARSLLFKWVDGPESCYYLWKSRSALNNMIQIDDLVVRLLSDIEGSIIQQYQILSNEKFLYIPHSHETEILMALKYNKI